MTDIVHILREKPYRLAKETEDQAKIRRQAERERGSDVIEYLRATIHDSIESLERNSTSAPVVECLKSALSFGSDASEPLERVRASVKPARGVEGPSPISFAKIVILCHAPGDKCLGCDHYHGKSARCAYALTQAGNAR
jgi:hypothetical protein